MADVIALLASRWVIVPLAVVAALAAGYLWGRVDGRSVGKVEQLQATVDAIEKRKDIDNEVSGMDRYRICLEFGGLSDACAALRGADETASGQ